MGYFPVRYDSRVVIYKRKMFIRLATGEAHFKNYWSFLSEIYLFHILLPGDRIRGSSDESITPLKRAFDSSDIELSNYLFFALLYVGRYVGLRVKNVGTADWMGYYLQEVLKVWNDFQQTSLAFLLLSILSTKLDKLFQSICLNFMSYVETTSFPFSNIEGQNTSTFFLSLSLTLHWWMFLKAFRYTNIENKSFHRAEMENIWLSLNAPSHKNRKITASCCFESTIKNMSSNHSRLYDRIIWIPAETFSGVCR